MKRIETKGSWNELNEEDVSGCWCRWERKRLGDDSLMYWRIRVEYIQHKTRLSFFHWWSASVWCSSVLNPQTWVRIPDQRQQPILMHTPHITVHTREEKPMWKWSPGVHIKGWYITPGVTLQKQHKDNEENREVQALYMEHARIYRSTGNLNGIASTCIASGSFHPHPDFHDHHIQSWHDWYPYHTRNNALWKISTRALERSEFVLYWYWY